MNTKKFTQIMLALVLAITVVSGIRYVSALGGDTSVWHNPTATPPGGNTSEPINVSSSYQAKTGGLDLGGIGLNKSTDSVPSIWYNTSITSSTLKTGVKTTQGNNFSN